ncbi:hypothetical protein AMR42_08690 [Limnothrix sp. PR1529]|nr:hypothetical protein AMR42_08690 [Limnothrix sp. PR1529]
MADSNWHIFRRQFFIELGQFDLNCPEHCLFDFQVRSVAINKLPSQPIGQKDKDQNLGQNLDGAITVFPHKFPIITPNPIGQIAQGQKSTVAVNSPIHRLIKQKFIAIIQGHLHQLAKTLAIGWILTEALALSVNDRQAHLLHLDRIGGGGTPDLAIVYL